MSTFYLQITTYCYYILKALAARAHEYKRNTMIDMNQLRIDLMACLEKYPASIEELAKKLEISRHTVQRFFNGKGLTFKNALKVRRYINAVMKG